MKIKSLLLGSATALAVGGVAQAADLSVAEPVDYVRVCDAFGAGFFYAPGTDTCLSIGGFVRFDAVVAGDEWTFDGVTPPTSEYSGWNFDPQAYLIVQAKSMTDWGPLTGYMAFYVGEYFDQYVILDEAYISIGPLLVGLTESLFNYDGLQTIDDNNGNGLAYRRGNVEQIRLSWAMNGFGLAVSLEDGDYWTTTDIMPDIVAAVTGSAGGVSGKLAFVYSDEANYYGYEDWAVNLGLTFNLDSLAAGDKLMVALAYGSAPYAAGGANWWFDWDESVWSALVSFKHHFAPNLSTAISVSYASGEGWYLSDAEFWGVNWNVNYMPVKNLAIIPELRWHQYQTEYYGDYGIEYTDWTAMLRIDRYFP